LAARVVADSARQLRGTLAVVLTPAGLFLEAAPNRPLLFAPVGTRAEPEGGVVVLALPDRVVTLRLLGAGYLERLAADAAAFLAGERPVPEPADYRQPWWLLGVGVTMGLALAAGPLVLAEVAELGTRSGLLLGLGFAAIGVTANAAIALLAPLRVGAKVGLMAGACVALMALFFFGATAYLTWGAHRAGPVAPEGTAPDPPTPLVDPPSDPPPAEPRLSRPPSHIDLAYSYGKSRLDDGPAEVTALAVAPTDGAILVGHANGETRIWPWDQASFDPPQPGPRADGPVQRIEFDPTGTLMCLTCPGGMVVASRDRPPRTPLKIPGDGVAAYFEPNRDRFAAVRAGRIRVRYTPMDLARDPPLARAANGIVLSTPKDETLPLGVRADFVLPNPKPTFLAWHPTGRLMCGAPDGGIVGWPAGGPAFTPITRTHERAVRAWANTPSELAFRAGIDFATGDDAGCVAVWQDRGMNPPRSKVMAAAITHLAFDSTGSRLIVADAAGGLVLWDVLNGEAVWRLKRPEPVRAVAFGTWDDVVLIADGRGVKVYHTAELARQAKADR
jgi:WD40 repeat protein